MLNCIVMIVSLLKDDSDESGDDDGINHDTCIMHKCT